MSPEELDEARAKEAYREWQEQGCQGDDTIDVASIAARLAREGWTPPEPVVDPDILAFREWAAQGPGNPRWAIEAGQWDNGLAAHTFLAGARMARERERERASLLEAYVQADVGREDRTGELARYALAKYHGEA